jgi:hypothetical protein
VPQQASEADAVTVGEPPDLVGSLRRGLTKLKVLPLAELVDVRALDENIERLAAVMEPLTQGTPREQLTMLGRNIIESTRSPHVRALPGREPHDLGDLDQVPVGIEFERCLDQHVTTKNDDDDLRGLLEFGVFTDHVARDSGFALLDARVRTSPQPWTPACSLSLTHAPRDAATSLGGWLEERRTLLLSGSFIDPIASATLMGLDPANADIIDALEPLHRDVHILVHSVGVGAKQAARSPREISPAALGNMIEMAAARLRCGGRQEPLRVLVFGSSKAQATRIALGLRKNARLLVEELDEKGVSRTNRSQIERSHSDAVAEVRVEYLRSAESRAVDRNYDLIVIAGTGRPSLASFQRLGDALAAGRGIEVRAAELVNESRLRAVVQAALRHAGLRGQPRVVLTTCDLTPVDLPGYVSSRARSTSSLFRKEAAPIPVAEHQHAAIASAVADLLLGTAIEPLRSWQDDVVVHARQRRLGGLEAVRHALAKVQELEPGEIRKSAPGTTGVAWRLVIELLVGWGVVTDGVLKV